MLPEILFKNRGSIFPAKIDHLTLGAPVACDDTKPARLRDILEKNF